MKNVINVLRIFLLMLFIGFFMAACELEEDKEGSTAPNRTITVVNNTGYKIGSYLSGLYIKPSTSSDWGSVIYDSGINNSESQTITLPAKIPNNGIYDLVIGSSTGKFSKYYFTITNGMTITFTSSDYDDGSNNPKITIKNLSGVTYNFCYIKPSSGSDWGINFGSVSNNSEKSFTLPFLLSNFNVFDIQMKSSSPDNTYTKNNVTVSNGMTVTYYPSDSDNSTIITPVIVIVNNTGYQIGYYLRGLYIKPSSSADWGSVIYDSGINNSGSQAVSLPARISNNGVYDIRLGSSTGNYTKYNVSLSYGMIITFTSSDLE